MTPTPLDETVRAILIEVRAMREQQDRIATALERLAPKPLDLSMPLGGGGYEISNRPLRGYDDGHAEGRRYRGAVRQLLDDLHEQRSEEG